MAGKYDLYISLSARFFKYDFLMIIFQNTESENFQYCM